MRGYYKTAHTINLSVTMLTIVQTMRYAADWGEGDKQTQFKPTKDRFADIGGDFSRSVEGSVHGRT